MMARFCRTIRTVVVSRRLSFCVSVACRSAIAASVVPVQLAAATMPRLRLRNHALQLTQRREAYAARREMRIERSALGAVELAVEILREPVHPDVVHRSKCLRSAIRA